MKDVILEMLAYPPTHHASYMDHEVHLCLTLHSTINQLYDGVLCYCWRSHNLYLATCSPRLLNYLVFQSCSLETRRVH